MSKLSRKHDMRLVIALTVLLSPATAFAQAGPPTVGGKPLVQVAPKGAAAKPQPLPMAGRLQACLEVEDGTRERLDCYDAVIAPKPAAGKRKPAAARAVTDCRLLKEQDERLTCFNGFVEKLPKPKA